LTPSEPRAEEIAREVLRLHDEVLAERTLVGQVGAARRLADYCAGHGVEMARAYLALIEERDRSERQGYLAAWRDLRQATKLARTQEEVGAEFVDGMVMGGSNALYLGFKDRFGEDPGEALEAYEAGLDRREASPGEGR
jgi:hypothetical protein